MTVISFISYLVVQLYDLPGYLMSSLQCRHFVQIIWTNHCTRPQIVNTFVMLIGVKIFVGTPHVTPVYAGDDDCSIPCAVLQGHPIIRSAVLNRLSGPLHNVNVKHLEDHGGDGASQASSPWSSVHFSVQ